MKSGGYVPAGFASGGHYSPGFKVNEFLFTAGLVPRNGNREVIGNTIEEQTRAALENLKFVLAEGGAHLTDVVQVRVHLADISLAPGFNQAYENVFGKHKPARTTVGSQLNGVMVEIDAIAHIGRA